MRAWQQPSGSVNTVFASRRFEFQKRSQLFIGMHNEALSVVAMCISNPNYSPLAMLPLTVARVSLNLKDHDRGDND